MNKLTEVKDLYAKSHNQIKKYKYDDDTLIHDINNIKKNVVEDPEETLKRRDESKRRLNDSIEELTKCKNKLSSNDAYVNKCKLKWDIAYDFSLRLEEITKIIDENCEFKNKLDELKLLKKDIENELIYYQNQSHVKETNLKNMESEYNILANDFNKYKSHKDNEINDINVSLNEWEDKYNKMRSSIDDLNALSQKDKIDYINKLRNDMDFIIDMFSKKTSELKEYFENLTRMSTIFNKFNDKYNNAISRVSTEYNELINKLD